MKLSPDPTISDVTLVVTKGTTPTTLGRNFTSDGVSFIKAEAITDDGILIPNKLVYIDEETNLILKRSRLQENDVLFSIAGVIGRTALVRISSLPANTNQAIAILRPDSDRITPKFLYYTVRSGTFLNRSLAHVVQTAQANVSLSVLSKIPIWLPPLPIQRRIASILSTYDELIENSQRRIKILEEMARALYREWFVHFRFPGWEGVPRVASPLGEIPEGWEVKRIGELTAYLSRGLSPSYDDNGMSTVLNQKCIRDQRLSIEPARRQNKPIPIDKQIKFGDVLINSTGMGTLGRVVQIYQDLGNCTVDSHVTIVRPLGSINTDFFGFALMSLEKTFEQLGVGATNQTELSRSSIATLELVIPSLAVQNRFGDIVRPIRTASINLAANIQNLRRTRDLLLPRLLSGQIDLSSEEALP